MKKIIANTFLGKKFFQGFFDFFLSVSLKGKNIGTGGDITASGERNALIESKKMFGDGKNLVFFDGGANVGDFTSLVLEVFDGASKIFCFEPLKKNIQALRERFGQNPNVVIEEFALDKSSGKSLIHFSDKNTKLASLYDRKIDFAGKANDRVEEIKTVSLSDFCSQQDIQRIDYLKLDTEGSELDVLAGARELVADKKITIIQFEFGGANIDSRTYFKDFWYLLSPNYHMYRILKDGLQPIEKYEERLEIFLTTNYLAVKK